MLLDWLAYYVHKLIMNKCNIVFEPVMYILSLVKETCENSCFHKDIDNVVIMKNSKYMVAITKELSTYYH